MAILLTRKTIILAKLEATYGTDPIPTTALDAILVGQPTLTVDGELLTRDFVKESLSRESHVVGTKVVNISFPVEMKSSGNTDAPGVSISAVVFTGSGLDDATSGGTFDGDVDGKAGTSIFTVEIDLAAVPDTFKWNKDGGTETTSVTITGAAQALSDGVTITFAATTGHTLADKWAITVTPTAAHMPEVDPLLRICSMKRISEHVTTPNVRYVMRTNDPESATVYAYFDGLLHKITGCYGSHTFIAEAGQYARWEFSLQGLYTAPTDVTFPTSTTTDTTKPPIVQSGTWVIGAFSPVVQALNIDLAIEITQRPDMNSADGLKGLRIVGRDPSGSINPEADLIANKDFWTEWSNATGQNINGNIGSVAGEKMKTTIIQAVYRTIGYGDRGGIRTNEIPFSLAESVGDDELEYKFE